MLNATNFAREEAIARVDEMIRDAKRVGEKIEAAIAEVSALTGLSPRRVRAHRNNEVDRITDAELTAIRRAHDLHLTEYEARLFKMIEAARARRIARHGEAG